VYLAKNAQGQVALVLVQLGGVAPARLLVVLVNGGTASSAEIVSGALPAEGRAEPNAGAASRKPGCAAP